MLATPLLKTEKNDVTFKENDIKRRKTLDLNFKIYGTKSVSITNIYQRQKLHSHVAFGLTNIYFWVLLRIYNDTIPHILNTLP